MVMRRLSLRVPAFLAVLAALSAAAEAVTVHYATDWRTPSVVFESGGAWSEAPLADEGGGWSRGETGTPAVGEFLFRDAAGGGWDHAPWWAGGWNYRTPRPAAEIWVRDGRVTLAPPESGRIEEANVPSAFLGGSRHVAVYLPAWYDRRPSERYPVLYLLDGQNLFDPGAPWGGWQVDAGLEAATRAGEAAPVIVVGIWNSVDRAGEYTPTRDPVEGGGGAARTLDFIERELKPWIDGRYRTLPAAATTAIGGSSLGGLLALHAGLTRPHVFGRLMALSPSLWWDGREILRRVMATPAWRLPRIRIYLDSGGAADGARDTAELRDVLQGKGFRYGTDLWHWMEPSHGHNEAAWRARFPRALAAIFPGP